VVIIPDLCLCMWGLQTGNSRIDLYALISWRVSRSERSRTEDSGHIACDSVGGDEGRSVSEVHLLHGYTAQNECVV
jgi:hypothetical protein